MMFQLKVLVHFVEGYAQTKSRFQNFSYFTYQKEKKDFKNFLQGILSFCHLKFCRNHISLEVKGIHT